MVVTATMMTEARMVKVQSVPTGDSFILII